MESLFGLSISAETVEAVELLYDDPSLTLTAIGEWKRSAGTDLASLAERLVSFIHANGVSAKRVTVGLDTSLLIVHTFPVDNGLSREEWQQHAQWELSQLVPTLPQSEYITDVFPLEQKAAPSTQEVLSISLRREDIRALRQSIREAGLELQGVDGAHFCAETMFLERSLEPPEGRALLVAVKKQRVEWSLLERSALVHYASRRAETADTIVEELLAALQTQQPVHRVVLYGPHVTREIQEHIQRATPVPVHVLDPFQALSVPADLPLVQHFAATSFRFASAVGAALRNAGEP